MGQSIEDVKTLTIRVIDHMCKTPLDKGYGSNEFKSIIHLFDRSFFAIENPQNVVEDYRLWIASSVLSSGDYPHRLTQIFIDLGEYSFGSLSVGEKSFNEQYIELLSSFQLTLCNYLELSELLAEKISMQDAYLKEIYRIYEAILPHDGTYGKEKKITLVVEIIIKTLYNMLQHENPTISSALKKYNLIDIFIYYAKSTNTSLQIASYLSLAYIYNEEEQLIPEVNEDINFLANMLASALKNPSTRIYGYSCEEILKGLRLLISNDQNGQFLCQSPILQSIQCTIKTLKGKVLEEVILFLLKLTFNSGIRDRIRRDFEVVLKDLDAFFKTKESETSSNIKRALNSILWQMSQDKNSSDYESNSNSSTQLEHIMISYSHKQKEIAFNLTKHLKEKGYKVWFDQDNMRYAVNTFRSLAEAVEKSYAVCIIYSENYKNSEYAEMEATYAVFLKKPIICLRAQRDYKPKGWLGLITARENRIDISGKYPFDEYFPNLCRRIDECIKIKTDHCS
uniref:TIR domain-containing protein n=1 Tax=Schistosoma mansoni TaxID=6183 RepID=A0A3Q0KKB7_SCHMA